MRTRELHAKMRRITKYIPRSTAEMLVRAQQEMGEALDRVAKLGKHVSGVHGSAVWLEIATLACRIAAERTRRSRAQ